MKRKIAESSSLRTGYHFTTMQGLADMMDTGTIDLSMAYGKSREQQLNKKLYPFFLSTTQYGNPNIGYPSMYQTTVARLNLNMDWLSSQGKFVRAMYFPRKDQDSETGNPNFYYQSEDRLLSDKSFLPFNKAVYSVDIYPKNDSGGLPEGLVDWLNSMHITLNIHGKWESEGYSAKEAPIKSLALIRAVADIWGDSAGKEAMSRAEKWIGREIGIEGTEGIYRVEASDMSTGIAKAIMMPYYAKWMREGKPFSDLKDIVNNALRKNKHG